MTVCKHCKSENTAFLMGGNWMDSGKCHVSRKYGDVQYPTFDKFDIVFCFDCSKLTEVEKND